MVAKQYYYHGGTGLGRVLVEFGLRLVRVMIPLPSNFRNNRFVAKMRKLASTTPYSWPFPTHEARNKWRQRSNKQHTHALVFVWSLAFIKVPVRSSGLFMLRSWSREWRDKIGLAHSPRTANNTRSDCISVFSSRTENNIQRQNWHSRSHHSCPLRVSFLPRGLCQAVWGVICY